MEQHTRFQYFILIFLGIMLNACGEIKTLNSSSHSSHICPASKTQKEDIVISSKTHSGKVVFSDFTTTHDIPLSTKTQNELTLKRGERLVATVERDCLNQEKSQRTFSKNFLPREVKNKKISNTESYEIILEQDLTLNEVEALALQDSCIKMISPNVPTKRAALPNDPYLASQTHLSAIKYTETFDFYFTGDRSINSDVVIAVIDDGIDLTHMDIKNNLWINTAELNGLPGVDDDGNGYIDDVYGYNFASQKGSPQHEGSDAEHGSHVAGLIAASTNNATGISGTMAKNAKIMSLNIFGPHEYAQTSHIDAAIRYAADMGAKIINMSISGKGKASSTESALRYAVSKGATIFIAAGNEGETLTASNFYTPASYGASIAGAITVGATDAKLTSVGSLCNFSNRSSTYVELGAPGCNTALGHQGLLSLFRNNEYGYMAGTSMASPIAAGAGAVVYAILRDVYGRNLSPAELESFMREGSRNIPAINSVIHNGKNVDLLTLKALIESEYVPSPQPVCP